MLERPHRNTFREIPRDLYRELLAFLTGRVRCRHAAADLTQESYARVLAAQRTGQVIDDPRALLYSTARHLVIDAARHRRVVDAWAVERAELDPQPLAPSTEYVVAHRQLVDRLAARLAALPARRRDVFVMFRVFGHTREEIAAALGITEAAVAKHVVRATLDCAAVFAEVRAALPAPELFAVSAAGSGELAWQA
jgi:RNA polymerase sigma factor (sigma-70 family)